MTWSLVFSPTNGLGRLRPSLSTLLRQSPVKWTQMVFHHVFCPVTSFIGPGCARLVLFYLPVQDVKRGLGQVTRLAFDVSIVAL